MNILHAKYALEVANAGSINKAAEILLVAQPNLSRSIKELETDLGITIFERSSKGMVLTPEGEEFLGYADKILKMMNDVEEMYKNGVAEKHKFSVCVPRASYISEAIAAFSCSIGSSPTEVFYKETNSQSTIQNVLNSEYKLGIIRYASNYEKYFKEMLNEKGLRHELIGEFYYVITMSRNSPLAKKTEISFDDLADYIEIAHADPYVPSLPLSVVKKTELPDNISRRIFVFERASQLDLLAENSETFMWVSPMPQKMLDRYNLVQRVCSESRKQYRDVLIYQKKYKLTDLDNIFITEVCNARRRAAAIIKDI